MNTLTKIRKAILDYRMTHGDQPPSAIYLTSKEEADLYDIDASKVGDSMANLIQLEGPRGLKRLYGVRIEWNAKDFNVA